jgi:cytidylate kinase
MPLVAISASYGAGGSRIAPALAERLGVPFLDRAIPIQVAERLEVSVDEAEAHHEQGKRSWLERVLAGFAAADPGGTPAPLPGPYVHPMDFHQATEAVLREQAATGAGVILGRGAVFALRDEPRVLRVRLDGPRVRRIAQVMAMEGLERDVAEQGTRVDRFHADYARQFYGADITDPVHYHLVLDSTGLVFDVCVDLIARAAAAVDSRLEEC